MTSSFWAGYLLKLAAVALVLGGIYAVGRFVSRLRIGAASDRRYVCILETTVLSPQVAVHVMRVGAGYLLIGGGSVGITALAELVPDDVERWRAGGRFVKST